ncbi:hypothetical protein [Cellulosimicrobium sp. CUA-896]|uniref:hypothetical protein n=1 Tax=Cellulosimicrobium sp. CUA-896 TaxID=1517881 RepID=UPI00095BA1DF|nr:hypothetical protein [Cellulosimicrobium sp. CUA-896]OLT52098.1 hypothetical protein BJF88_14485 [Cellulosimicrobium sp. CUA-896]
MRRRRRDGTATLPEPSAPLGGQTSAGPDEDATDDATDDGAEDAELTFRTQDGGIEITGTSDNCASTTGSDLQATFTEGEDEVGVTVTDGAGQVTVTGGTTFEGTTTQFSIDGEGNVEIAGTGAPAEGQDEPVPFTVTGTCAAED